jgi:hypothetical protein
MTSCLATDDYRCDDKWSKSLAVRSKNFIDNVKFLMGVMARGRTRIEAGESFQLREVQSPYIDPFGGGKSEIGVKNAYVWEWSL